MPEGKKQPRPVKVAEGVWRMPSGSLQIRWYAGRVNGREKTRTRTLPKGTTTREAKSVRQREIDKTDTARDTNLGSESVRDFADRWSKPGWAPTTLAHNRERVGVFCRDFGHRKPKTITRTEARLWATGGVAPPGLKGVQNWSGVTTDGDGEIVVPPHRSAIPAVRGMFNDMVEDEHVDLDRNVFNNLRLEQSKGRSGITVLSESELERLVTIARRLHGQSWAGLVEFAAWTMLRPAEVYALRWRDIDLAEGVVRVRRQFRSKTNDEVSYLKTEKARRDVLLLPPAERVLQEMPRHVNDDLIFMTKTGQRFTARTQVWYWAQTRAAFWDGLDEDRKCSLCVREMRNNPDWSPAQREHQGHDGIQPDFVMYELRHFGATVLAQLPGVTPMDVADQMGHADKGELAMERYFHIESSSARARIRRGFETREAPAERADEREAM